MPELPEVEVLSQYLASLLPGRRIRSVVVHRERSVRPDSGERFTEALTGKQFVRVRRRAKYLIFEVRGSKGREHFLGHLGMTGRMFVARKRMPLPKHAAVTMELDRGRLVYEDPRSFGRLSLQLDALASLGPEPLSPEVDSRSFWRQLKRSRQAVKARLLSSEVVVGVGNIYASESLFLAGIDPRTASHRITLRQAERLLEAIRLTLKEAIAFGSSLLLDWSGSDRRDALFYYGRKEAGEHREERFNVYNREGQPCRQCGRGIRRVIQAARSSFYCPGCQQRRSPRP